MEREVFIRDVLRPLANGQLWNGRQIHVMSGEFLQCLSAELGIEEGDWSAPHLTLRLIAAFVGIGKALQHGILKDATLTAAETLPRFRSCARWQFLAIEFANMRLQAETRDGPVELPLERVDGEPDIVSLMRLMRNFEVAIALIRRGSTGCLTPIEIEIALAFVVKEFRKFGED